MTPIDIAALRRHIGTRISEEDVATEAPLRAIAATFDRPEAPPRTAAPPGEVAGPPQGAAAGSPAGAPSSRARRSSSRLIVSCCRPMVSCCWRV